MEAAQRGETKYTAVAGTQLLRKAITDDLLRRKGVSYTPDEIVVRDRACDVVVCLKQIKAYSPICLQVSNGAKQAVLQSLMTLVAPGKVSRTVGL